MQMQNVYVKEIMFSKNSKLQFEHKFQEADSPSE